MKWWKRSRDEHSFQSKSLSQASMFSNFAKKLQEARTGLRVVLRSFLTSSRERLVDGAVVDALVGLLPVGRRFEPHGRHVCVQLFGPGLRKHVLLTVPARAFEE